MTIKAEPPGFADRILGLLGKERAVFIPETVEPYGYYVARREGFLRALLRSKRNAPPKGWSYLRIPDGETTDQKGMPQKK